MKKKAVRKRQRSACKYAWIAFGVCIILTIIMVVTIYQKHRERIAAQSERKLNYVTVTDEKTYREIAWEYSVESDIVYRQAEGQDGVEDLKLDIYRTAKEGPNPAIVLLHGGGLTTGDKASAGLLKSLATDFAGMGYVVVVPNYRLSSQAGDGALKKAMEDAKAACEWVQTHGNEYGVDVEHVALGGYSSGADISINLCYTKEYGDLNRQKLFAVIDISGSGIHYRMTEQAVPGCVIIHGTEDTTVRFNGSKKVADKLTKQGIDVSFHPLEGLNHDLLSRYDEVCNRVAEYLYKQLTGEVVIIDIKAEVNPEYQKVLQRMENGMTYEVPQLDVQLDGFLEEWQEVAPISLNQLKDAGDSLPTEADFSGQVMLAWKETTSTILYIAAKIQDDEIKDTVAADGKWYQDDCLEIVFDTSTEQALQQLTKWVIGAGSQDLSVLATEENTTVVTNKTSNETLYEISIDISKIPDGTYQGEANVGFVAGESIGFSICYNDGEGKDRQHQVGWTKGKSSDRTTLGTLYFK